MSTEKQGFRTPGSTGQIIVACVVAVCGAVLLTTAVLDQHAVRAVVAAVQTAAGLYLVLWHVRERRRGPR